MVVGIGHISVLIHDSQSLKAKRQVLKKLIAQVKNNFNVSVAEVGANDLWQRAEVGIALTGNDKGVINSKLDKIVNFIEDLGIVEIIDYEFELVDYHLED